jgi:hypothetical protein
VKIKAVRANNHRKSFEVETHRGVFSFPYSAARPSPSPQDRVVEVYVDPELGREGFTYALESGAEGSVHVDSVLEYNEDPGALADLLLHRLTVEALDRLDESGLSRREIARRLGTSATQLYRLLDPTNNRKSLQQVIALLHVLGCEVKVSVKRKKKRESA